jgi:tetratricopeptide (TPR) repeat protein
LLLLDDPCVGASSSSSNQVAEERVNSEARVSTHDKDFIPSLWITPHGVDESPLYAWTAILSLDVTEASRNDMRRRARTKFLHHKAKSPKAPSKELYWHKKAMHKSRARRYKEALSLLRKGARLFPANPFFPHSAGALYQKLGRLDDAEASFKKALEVDPNNSVSMQALARVYAHRGDTMEARDLFKQAVEVRSTAAAIVPHMAGILRLSLRMSADISRTSACENVC